MTAAQFWTSLITLLVAMQVIMFLVAYLVLLERRMASWIQDRMGPNRVGPFGLLQPIADGLKFFFKEDYTPPFVDRVLFVVAPMTAFVTALLGWAVIPWGGSTVINGEVVLIAGAPVNIGVIYILAVSSLAVYGVVLAGYASNNKYSFLGGLRATSQMLSYEIPMGLCVLIVLLMYSETAAEGLILAQAAPITEGGVWTIVLQPVLAIIFFTCMLAETNRAPFDLAEAEQELVGGFHTEYSSMKMALFFLGEYVHMITAGAFFTLLFLGGWDLPFVREPAVGGWGWVVLKIGVFATKVVLLVAIMMWIRWTLPRFRFDQLMKLAWRGLIPITLIVLVGAGVIVYFDMSLWWMLPLNVVTAAVVLLVGPKLPEGPAVNRKVALQGSRFSPASA